MQNWILKIAITRNKYVDALSHHKVYIVSGHIDYHA